MIRLAASGEEALWSEVTSRLRGATIATCFESSAVSPPESCNAVLFVEPQRPEALLIEQSLTAGNHVLLGADSCFTIDVLDALSVAAQQSRRQLALLNPDRFRPSRQLIRQQLDAGKLGEPGLVRMHRWESAATNPRDTSSGLPAPLVRDLDLALWLIGRPLEVVYAVEPLANDRDAVPGRCVQVHLGFSGGGMALVDYTDRLPPGDDYQSLSVIGSSGAAYVDDHQNMQLVYRGGHPRGVRADEGSLRLAGWAQEFVDGLQASRDMSSSVSAWCSVLAVADAVQRSCQSRQAIVVAQEGR